MAELTERFVNSSMCIAKVKGKKFQVKGVAFSSDCHYAVFVTQWSRPKLHQLQPRLHLFDLYKATELWQTDFPDNYVNCLAITPDSQEIILSSTTATRFFNLADGKEINAFYENDTAFSQLVFTSDGKNVLCDSTRGDSATQGAIVRYIKLKEWREINRFVGHTKG